MLDFHANTLFLATRIQTLGFRVTKATQDRRRMAEMSDFVRFRAPGKSKL